MSETATVEAPTRENINPELAKLFEIEAPAEYPVATTDASGEETPVAKAPPEKKPEPPAPTEEKKPEDKPDALKLRLAPDFSAAEEKKPDAEPDADLVELDKAIKDAPTEKARIDLSKFRDQLATLKTQVQTLKTPPTSEPIDYAQIKTTLETVTKERDDLLARVERTNLLESPKFQKEHLEPRAKQFARLQGVVKEGGANPEAIQRAIAMPHGKPRIEALDEIREQIGSEMLKGQFDRLVEDIDSRTADINERLRNAKQTAEEMKRSETVQTHEQRQKVQKQLEGLLGSALDDLTNNVGIEVLKKTGRPEYKWWDDQVDEIHAVAREVYLESTPEKAAIASVLAAAAGPLRELLQNTQKALKAVEQENRELKGADPTLKDGGKPPVVETVAGDADSILEGLRAGKYKK